MSWLGLAEFKVGALVVIVGSLIAFMTMQVSDDPSYLGRSKKVWFVVDNAGGLIANSAVRSAGIPVGVIKKISLVDGMARIDITVKSDVNLTTSASVEIKAQGILGDKHVEVYPGNPNDPPMADGSQILNVKDKGSLDNLIGQVSDITSSLKTVAESLRESVSEDGTRKHVLGRIVKNIETLTSDLSQMTSENKDKIGDIVDQVHGITESLSDVMNDESDTGLKKSWQRIAGAAKNLEEITAKINNGEGTVGRLINDESTVEELNTTIEGINSIFDSAGKIQTGFDFNAYYLSSIKETKSTIGITIQPGLDRYYFLGLVDDPAGVVETERKETTGTTTGDITEIKTYKNKLKLTAYYARNFWDLTLKAGMIENAAGLGVDYHFFRRKLKVSLEAFDFSQTNLRASATLHLLYGIYLTGGISDALDKNQARSGYLGAGIFVTNDDLKLLLTRAPF